MTTVTKNLAKSLNELLVHTGGVAPEVREKARAALDAYKESEEFKREQFEELLRDALKTANALVDTVQLLRTNQLLSDSDTILLTSAEQSLAEGADYLNTVIEGTTP